MKRCFKKINRTFKLVDLNNNNEYSFPKKSDQDDAKIIYGVLEYDDGTLEVYYSDNSQETVTDKSRISTIKDYVNNNKC